MLSIGIPFQLLFDTSSLPLFLSLRLAKLSRVCQHTQSSELPLLYNYDLGLFSDPKTRNSDFPEISKPDTNVYEGKYVQR